MTPLELFFIATACSILGMVWALGALWRKTFKKAKEATDRAMLQAALEASERIIDPPLIAGPTFKEADWAGPKYTATMAETEKLMRHAKTLAAIYAQDKAHVKALYNAWQNDKKRASIYKPGSTNEVKAKKRAALARKEWQAANTIFLKHFGDYAP